MSVDRRLLGIGSRRQRDLIHSPTGGRAGTVGKRNHKKIAIWTCLHVSGNSKISSNQQSLTLGNVEFIGVVRHSVCQPGILREIQVTAVGRQFEMKQVAAL